MNSEKQKWLLLAILSLIWGSSFILIKKSLEHFSPYQVGALRVLIAGLFLMPVAWRNRKLFPRKNLPWLIVAALSGNFIPMFLFPIAETKVSSSIAGIVNSLMPIFVIIVGGLLWKIRAERRQVTGVVISFSGACLLMWSGSGTGTAEYFSIGLLLLATLLYAVSTTTVKAKLSELPAKLLSAFVFSFVLIGPSMLALVFSGFFHSFRVDADHMAGLGIVATLSVFGTGLAMMLNYRLLSISTPLFASTVTLLMPIVAVGWGMLDGERLTPIQSLGAAVIIGGLLFLRQSSPRLK
ncbi:MAG: DMT family transporter [Chryseobacterium sp.]|nr:MAG: DMT family transporter [Chryseobacterium sp.]